MERDTRLTALLDRLDQAIAEAENLVAESKVPDESKALEAIVELQRVRVYVEWKLSSPE